MPSKCINSEINLITNPQLSMSFVISVLGSSIHRVMCEQNSQCVSLISNWMYFVWWMNDRTDVRNQIMFECERREGKKKFWKGIENVCLCLTAVDWRISFFILAYITRIVLIIDNIDDFFFHWEGEEMALCVSKEGGWKAFGDEIWNIFYEFFFQLLFYFFFLLFLKVEQCLLNWSLSCHKFWYFNGSGWWNDSWHYS